MSLDFALMQKIAAFADRRPSLKWMNLGPSMEQFSNTMSAQVGWDGTDRDWGWDGIGWGGMRSDGMGWDGVG